MTELSGFESNNNVPTFQETLDALSQAFDENVPIDQIVHHKAFEVFNAFESAKENEIVELEQRTEGGTSEEITRKIIERDFEIGKLYVESGYVSDGKEILLRATVDAELSAYSRQFADLKRQIRDYIVLTCGTDEEIIRRLTQVLESKRDAEERKP